MKGAPGASVTDTLRSLSGASYTGATYGFGFRVVVVRALVIPMLELGYWSVWMVVSMAPELEADEPVDIGSVVDMISDKDDWPGVVNWVDMRSEKELGSTDVGSIGAVVGTNLIRPGTGREKRLACTRI